jgi:hypothetical protein
LRTAVVAGVVVIDDGGVVDHHFALVHIRDVYIADVGHGAVVVEVIVVPVSALVSAAYIAKAIVHAAIKADIAAPISMIKTITATKVAPVARRPERALVRRLRPGTRNPVITLRRIGPVARCP